MINLFSHKVAWLMLLMIKGYRYLLSPILGLQCRFAPTCSVYAEQAIGQHGPWRGGGLAIWRIMRCNPWCRGGFDPVPASCGCGHSVSPSSPPQSASSPSSSSSSSPSSSPSPSSHP